MSPLRISRGFLTLAYCKSLPHKDLLEDRGLETVDVTTEKIRTCVKTKTPGGAKSGALKSGRTTLPPESRKASAPVVGTTSGPHSTTGSPAHTAPADDLSVLPTGSPTSASAARAAHPVGDLPASVDPAAQEAQLPPEGQKTEPLPPEVASILQNLTEAQRAALLALLMRRSGP